MNKNIKEKIKKTEFFSLDMLDVNLKNFGLYMTHEEMGEILDLFSIEGFTKWLEGKSFQDFKQYPLEEACKADNQELIYMYQYAIIDFVENNDIFSEMTYAGCCIADMIRNKLID